MEETVMTIDEEIDDTPRVELDRANNIFEITGMSLPENAPGFYKPVKQWLSAYVNDPNPRTEVLFRLEYFNSASARQIFEILVILAQIIKTGKTVKVVWQYKKNDEIIEMKGQELETMTDVPFELRAF